LIRQLFAYVIETMKAVQKLFLPSKQQAVKTDGLVKNRKTPLMVIPAEAGIQSHQLFLDPGVRRGDGFGDFLRSRQDRHVHVSPCRPPMDVRYRRKPSIQTENTMRNVELRSDTMTRPTPAMRKAMAEAEVGDDVFGEDPTVNRLEKLAAERLNKEAALFVPSGTMANLVSQMAHCGRGDEMILGSLAHSFYYEQGGSAAVAAIHPRTVPNQLDGKLPLDELEAAIRGDNIHFPRTRLIALENTHNLCGGAPLEPAYLRSVGDIARRHGIKLHIDGARLFNAAAALGVPAQQLAVEADSVSFCLSKGLAAPVGSVVCGSREFIQTARRARKILGGGMRQAGVLAAAGIVALDDRVDRLAEDHANAHRLAMGLAGVSGLELDPEQYKTNIVYFNVVKPGLSAAELVSALQKEGVRMLASGPRKIRAVTHYEVTSRDIDYALEAMARVIR
jgi:threonine aldolase